MESFFGGNIKLRHNFQICVHLCSSVANNLYSIVFFRVHSCGFVATKNFINSFKMRIITGQTH